MSNDQRPWLQTARDVADTGTPVVGIELAPRQADTLTVVTDDAGHPRWLAGPAGPAPVLTVASDRLLGDLLSSGSVLPMLAAGLPALVVVDDGRVAGTIPLEKLRVVLAAMTDADEAFTGALDSGTDFTPAGRPRPPRDRLRIWCATCGGLNELEEFPEADQPCISGGHALQPEWRR
ncbi:hypothetical protein [Actinoplanes sp. N902-109]|uniref:hypothetical protein n=1 Tax=Actinoplanes sp. (strain N902-109) TaxID=649831 RepID=UPI0003A67183|nr:hypothetical protein [Actinoplanes sp. N902-109]